MPNLHLTGTSQRGQYYLLYESLHLTAEGPLSGGPITVSSQLGRQHDTLYLALDWAWLGGESPFSLTLRPASFFSLGGQLWRFAQVGRFTLRPKGSGPCLRSSPKPPQATCTAVGTPRPSWFKRIVCP